MPTMTEQIVLISTKVWQQKPARFPTTFRGNKEFYGINPNDHRSNAEFLEIFAGLKQEYNKKIMATPWPLQIQTRDQRELCFLFFIVFF